MFKVTKHFKQYYTFVTTYAVVQVFVLYVIYVYGNLNYFKTCIKLTMNLSI